MSFRLPYVDPFILADQFEGFVDREFATPSEIETHGDLYNYFVAWIEEGREEVVMHTAGKHSILVLTWVIVAARFEQQPENFLTIRKWVTKILDLWPDATHLPNYLDEGFWNAHVFATIHRRRQ